MVIDRDHSEDIDGSWQPLIPVTATTRTASEDSNMVMSMAQAVEEALTLVREQLEELRGNRAASCAETSELLRDTCQNLSSLATTLQQAWHQEHPGEAEPNWAVEVIPAEELARIGWDFHSNRVQIKDTGVSLWHAFGYLLSGDQSASFEKPPSPRQIEEALRRVETRLECDLVLCR